MDETMLTTDAASLYERDFFAWCLQQAQALRRAGAGGTAALDYENLAEEIESLGSSQRRELGSRISTIIEHLAKLEQGRGFDPRPGWEATIARERDEIERLLEDSPSLRAQLPALVQKEASRTLRRVGRELLRRSEITEQAARAMASEATRYSPDQVIGGWFPSSESAP